MNIFTFWVPENGMHPYIKLCMKTWEKFIPDAEIHLLNSQNLLSYIDVGFYGKRLFGGEFSLPQIADAVRAMVLEKYGGIWLDADTIILKNDFDKYTDMGSDKEITFLGYPNEPSVHLAYIYAKKNAKMLQNWVAHNGYKIYNLSQEKMDNTFWSYLGNSIVDPYIKSHPDEVNILDVVSQNCTPEINFSPGNNPYEAYVDFYFKKRYHVSDIPSTMVMLHNSWTPEPFKRMSAEEFLSYDCTISNILIEALELYFSEIQ